MFRNAFPMKSMSQIFVAICTMALAAAGCHPASYAADDKSKVHVGIVFDIGGKDDRSFNAAAWEGVKRAARDFPIVLRDVEPGDPTSIEPAMRAFAERGYFFSRSGASQFSISRNGWRPTARNAAIAVSRSTSSRSHRRIGTFA